MNATFKALLAALIGGASTGAAQASSSGASLKATGFTAGAGALISLAAYLLKSPLSGSNQQ